VSHGADLPTAAAKLGDRYVMAWKPHPVTMIARYDQAAIREELRRGLRLLAGCHVVLCLRDTQTLFGEPERAAGWTRAACEVASELA
jgi:hypothetical protein